MSTIPCAAVFVLSILFAGTAEATPILDQQNSPPIPPITGFAGAAVANDRSQIETFTVGISGDLTSVDVRISKGTLTVEDVVLSVWSTDAQGLPQTQLASAALPPTAIDNGDLVPPFTTFDLGGTGVPVRADEVFAIVLDSNAINVFGANERYLWRFGGDDYARGMSLTKIGSAFTHTITGDFIFRTFVDPTAVSEPPAWVLLMTVLCGICVRRLQMRPKRL